MSVLENLKTLRGSTHSRKRKGRGDGSGLGGTAGKGHKGQRARTGGRVRRGFEGGQTPLMRRLPKFGFANIFRTEYEVVNLEQLNGFSKEIAPESLKAAGLIHGELVKVLAKGELKKPLHVRAHKFSEAAKKAIEAAGGKVEVIQ